MELITENDGLNRLYLQIVLEYKLTPWSDW